MNSEDSIATPAERTNERERERKEMTKSIVTYRDPLFPVDRFQPRQFISIMAGPNRPGSLSSSCSSCSRLFSLLLSKSIDVCRHIYIDTESSRSLLICSSSLGRFFASISELLFAEICMLWTAEAAAKREPERRSNEQASERANERERVNNTEDYLSI